MKSTENEDAARRKRWEGPDIEKIESQLYDPIMSDWALRWTVFNLIEDEHEGRGMGIGYRSSVHFGQRSLEAG